MTAETVHDREEVVARLDLQRVDAPDPDLQEVGKMGLDESVGVVDEELPEALEEPLVKGPYQPVVHLRREHQSLVVGDIAPYPVAVHRHTELFIDFDHPEGDLQVVLEHLRDEAGIESHLSQHAFGAEHFPDALVRLAENQALEALALRGLLVAIPQVVQVRYAEPRAGQGRVGV